MRTRLLPAPHPDLLVERLDALGDVGGRVLLDSARGGRWDVSGLAAGRVEVRGGRARWIDAAGERDLGDAPTALDELLRPRREARRGAPFQGGWVGLLGYGAGAFMDRIPAEDPGPDGPPDAALLWVDAAVCLDREEGALHLGASGRADPFGVADPARAAARLEELEERLLGRARPREPEGPGPLLRPGGRLPDPGPFEEAVARAREHIGRGDVFQVNLAQRFELGEVLRPVELYRLLRARNAAPYAGFLEAGDLRLLSCSPELLVRTAGREAVTQPIAGTFPRGDDPASDAAYAAALRAHPKECAEHVMLVDLERNDLGRVAEFGSVEVEELLGVHSFATVHHLVSTVRARLRADAHPFDVLRAVFPGGTITGAPKIRATEIIHALEGAPRGPYTGALGFVDASGDQTWNILIRTLVDWRGRASVHGGAGIVWDSDPAREYRETVQKVRRFLDLFGVDAAAADLEALDAPGGVSPRGRPRRGGRRRPASAAP